MISRKTGHPARRPGSIWSGRRRAGRRAAAVLVASLASLLFLSPGADVCAKEKPEIVRCEVQYLDSLVRLNVQWQSPNPVTFIRAIVGKEQKDVKVDEYDNRRNPDGYWGDATIVVNAAMTPEGVPYVVQLEDDLRQKSERVTGKVKPSAGPAEEPGGGTFAGTGTQPGAGTWPGSGTAGGGASWPGGAARTGAGQPGGRTWSAGASWPGGGVSVGLGTGAGAGQLPGGAPSGGGGIPGGSGIPGGGTLPGTGIPGAGPGQPPGGGTAAGGRVLQNDGFTLGGRVAFVNGLKSGDEVGVVLGPVDRPFQVTKIAFLCGGSPGTGIVTVKLSQDMGGPSPGAPVFTESYQIEGTDTAIQEIEITGQIPSFPAGASVRVSFQFQHAGFPGIGYDPTGSPAPNRNWVSRSGAWSDFGAAGIPGNGIVHATVVTQ